MLIFIALRSIFQGFHMPTVNSIIPIMVPQEKLSRINGINFLFSSVIQLGAQFAAAALLAFLTFTQLFWADIITYFIALIPLLLITIPSVQKISTDKGPKEKVSFFKEFRLGLSTVKLIPGLIALIIMGALINFLIRPLDTLLSIYILIDHGGTELTYALMGICFNGGMIVGALFASFKKNWSNKMKTIFISLGIAGIGYIIFAIAPIGWFFIIGLGGVVLGLTLPIINALYQTSMQIIVPKDKIGRITSIDHTLSMSISPIGTIISGPLAEMLGTGNLFLYSALLMILVTILIWGLSSVRRINYEDQSLIDEVSSKINNISV